MRQCLWMEKPTETFFPFIQRCHLKRVQKSDDTLVQRTLWLCEHSDEGQGPICGCIFQILLFAQQPLGEICMHSKHWIQNSQFNQTSNGTWILNCAGHAGRWMSLQWLRVRISCRCDAHGILATLMSRLVTQLLSSWIKHGYKYC